MTSKVTSENSHDILKPIVSFGLITDIHYADADDRWNFSKTFVRHYRNSLQLVSEARDYWLKASSPISFVIQLGDLIDGLCRTNHTSTDDLQTILKQFEPLTPIYHIWGNHEFYNFSRKDLLHGPLCSFDTKDISPAHYGTIEVCPKLRIIALDTYELSLLGVEEDDELYVQAKHFLKKHNPNENMNDRTGLDEHEQRFIQLNGGLTQKQLDWLREQLIQAANQKEKVIIIGHIPIHPKACDEIALLWNYEEVLNVLWTFERTILAYLAGHCHEGGYFYDEKQIHHVTLNAIVECELKANSFATVHVYNDYIIIEGTGQLGTVRINLENV